MFRFGCRETLLRQHAYAYHINLDPGSLFSWKRGPGIEVGPTFETVATKRRRIDVMVYNWLLLKISVNLQAYYVISVTLDFFNRKRIQINTSWAFFPMLL